MLEGLIRLHCGLRPALARLLLLSKAILGVRKKGALSPPFYPQDYETVLPEVELIIAAFSRKVAS